jgi:hypothetical protein
VCLASTTFYAIIATYFFQVLRALERFRVIADEGINITLNPVRKRRIYPPRQTLVELRIELLAQVY